MQEQNSGNLPFPDNESFHSRLSSNRSIDRISQRLSNRSLNAKPSIIEVLDLDCIRGRKSSSGRLSQVDDDSQSRNLRFSANSCKDIDSNSIAQQKYQMFEEIPNFTENPIQYSRHECLCTKQICSFISCPCMFAINQLCVVGLCCLGCIQKKNASLVNDIGPFSFQSKQKKSSISKPKRQNNHIKSIKKAHRTKVQKQKYDFVYCTCKKTQCLKKYCPCFALNKQCNECCICEDCHNHSDQEESQYKNAEGLNAQELNKEVKIQEEKIEMMIDENIDNYFEDSLENYDNVEFNKAMDFDPVDFSEFNK